ncbi:MAG: hypothetical protein LBL96_11925 [Clostridiales bacterium]|jgi:hypothetical protein|nr:hypothetical protein [Clostridiales bacterium]
MKRLLALLAISVYSVPLSLFLIFTLPDFAAGKFFIPIGLMVVACCIVVVNIIGALYSAARNKKPRFLAVLIVKLILVPFYIVNFVIWAGGSMIFHIAIIFISFLPIVIPYTLFTILGTSAHNISGLIVMRRNGQISTKQLVFHSILQLISVLDVIDSIVLAIKFRPSRYKPEIDQQPLVAHHLNSEQANT